MDLHSDYPYWMIKEGIKHSYPFLTENLKTDVLVIGGGISGALVAHHLSLAGLDVVIAEKRHVAHGSTSASTAMLQYEIDRPLFELIESKGRQDAVRSYRICLEAINEIERICKDIPGNADFRRIPSLYYASYKKHVKEIIEPEYEARSNNGFVVERLTEKSIAQKYGFDAPGGILSRDGAQVNPYLLTQYLLFTSAEKGARIYDHTEIIEWSAKKDHVDVMTSQGTHIQTGFIVIACGYESQKYLPEKVSKMHSTYAVISKPFHDDQFWYKNSLIWETKRPYLYLRTTNDNRIIVGGRDEAFYNPEKRDKLISKKCKQLEADFKKLFPEIPFNTDFSWAGTFAETEDGLPYIGAYDHPRVLFAMGYGGNGITFSVAAAHILKEVVLGKKHPDARLFAFDR